MIKIPIDHLKFDEHGLIPAIAQEHQTGTVLMMAYMNRESLEKTMETGETWYWSRSRKKLWHKGETSGNTQRVKRIAVDCDGDALLMTVEQKGDACHTGAHSCFFSTFGDPDGAVKNLDGVIENLSKVIHERNAKRPAGSYTTKLLDGGIDRILKKVGEEAGEVIIAAKNHRKEEIRWEVADLLYHLLVMLEQEGVSLDEVAAELAGRAKTMTEKK